MGVFARFFFGLETYNQIFISIAVALAFLGLSMFESFWENQFENIFNTEDSQCGSRWLAFLLSLGWCLDFGFAWLMANNNIDKFEKKPYHPYGKSHCKTSCFNDNKFLSHNSLIHMAWFSFVPMMFFYFAVTKTVKYTNNQLNLIKYAKQFMDMKNLIIRLALYGLVNVPIILSAFITLKVWWCDLIFKFAMAFLWCVLYRWLLPMVKRSMDNYLASDMFAPWMNHNDEERGGLI